MLSWPSTKESESRPNRMKLLLRPMIDEVDRRPDMKRNVLLDFKVCGFGNIILETFYSF